MIGTLHPPGTPPCCLAISCLWAVVILDTQVDLLKLPWPHDILDHPKCQAWQVDDKLILNGPRMSMGIVSGTAIRKIPNPSTGRADYFGTAFMHVY